MQFLRSLRAGLPGGTEPRRHRPLTIALSFGGVAFVILQLVIGAQANLFPIPGRDELIWDRVGDAIWTGAPVYYNAPRLTDSFVYAPPVAVAFAGMTPGRVFNPAPRLIISCSSSALLDRASATSMLICF